MTVGNNSHLTSWFCKVEAKPKLLSNMLSQREINLEKLQRIASTGIPDGGGLREKAWKPSSSNEDIRFIRLSCYDLCYLSSSHDLWGKQLKVNRQKKYANLKEGSSPESVIFISNIYLGISGVLCAVALAFQFSLIILLNLRQSKHIWKGYEELSSTKRHKDNDYTEIVEQIDRDLQRTHPDLPFFPGESSISCKKREAMKNIILLFAKLNPEIRYVQGMNEVLAPIWITLLLTQEFKFEYILRIWDTLLSNPFGDMLLRICCAMLLCVKSKLLSGDFVTNLKLLQHYPDDINIEYLLQVAKDIRPDTSYYCLSL
ncbi:TBC1 domain family member 13 [Glycine max]|nr:TBC1 domain family member 13 [Glycine max]